LPFDQFWQDFDTWQWMFCAPQLKYFRTVNWEERMILPFTCGDELGAGASGVAKLINIHPSHDFLHSSEKRSRTISPNTNGNHAGGPVDVEVRASLHYISPSYAVEHLFNVQ
jgi:hypothetical protein